MCRCEKGEERRSGSLQVFLNREWKLQRRRRKRAGVTRVSKCQRGTFSLSEFWIIHSIASQPYRFPQRQREEGKGHSGKQGRSRSSPCLPPKQRENDESHMQQTEQNRLSGADRRPRPSFYLSGIGWHPPGHHPLQVAAQAHPLDSDDGLLGEDGAAGEGEGNGEGVITDSKTTASLQRQHHTALLHSHWLPSHDVDDVSVKFTLSVFLLSREFVNDLLKNRDFQSQHFCGPEASWEVVCGLACNSYVYQEVWACHTDLLVFMCWFQSSTSFCTWYFKDPCSVATWCVYIILTLSGLTLHYSFFHSLLKHVWPWCHSGPLPSLLTLLKYKYFTATIHLSLHSCFRQFSACSLTDSPSSLI